MTATCIMQLVISKTIERMANISTVAGDYVSSELINWGNTCYTILDRNFF